MTTPCTTRIRLYGGLRKNQRQNFVAAPPGTKGVVTTKDWDELHTLFYRAKFVVDGKVVYVRCALDSVEVET